MRSRSHALTLLTALVTLAPAARAAQPPLAVSPGDPSRIARVEARCPTFHWGTVRGATGYELAVYRIHVDRDEPVLELSRRFPGSVSGWTPSLGACLARGARYAWSIRAVVDGGETEWSRPMPFEVSGPAETVSLAAALEVVQRHLAEAGAEAGAAEGLTSTEAVDEKAASGRSSRAAASSPAPAMVAQAQLTIDGGVVAGSFTGDGSTLTSVDAASLQGAVPGDFAAASHPHSAEQITGGVLADARIPAGIARDAEVAAGFLPLGGGTLGGGLIVQAQDLNLPDSFLQGDDIVVESRDAVLGLYSSTSGNLGSAIVFGETPELSTFGTDKWAIVRETNSGGKDLRITYGTNPSYGANPTKLELRDDGSLRLPGKLEVSSSGEITGRGIARAFGFVAVDGSLERASPNVLSSRRNDSPLFYEITLESSICASDPPPVVLVSVWDVLTTQVTANYNVCVKPNSLQVKLWKRSVGWGATAREFSFVIF